MSSSDRYCPLCRSRRSEATCPVHGIPTLAAGVVGDGVALLAEGTVLAGRFRIDGVLGRGGMGQVYRATQLSIQRPVAVKTLHPRLLQDPDHLGRFYREARAASLLEGPHIVRVYDFGVDEPTSTPFIAMELVRGSTLRTRIGRSPLGPGQAAAIAAQVCRALAEAHAAGIVHRDLKSENILLADGPVGPATVKVMDFGVAKLDRARHGETGSLTASGALIGTPRTMAPEQILGEPVDARTDLYALGCVLHELLTGGPPFAGDDPISVINQHLLAVPPPLDPLLGVPPALVRLRDALMAKDRAQRPPDAASVARQLEALAGTASQEDPGDAALSSSDTLVALPEAPDTAPGAETVTAPGGGRGLRLAVAAAVAALAAVALVVALPEAPSPPPAGASNEPAPPAAPQVSGASLAPSEASGTPPAAPANGAGTRRDPLAARRPEAEAALLARRDRELAPALLEREPGSPSPRDGKGRVTPPRADRNGSAAAKGEPKREEKGRPPVGDAAEPQAPPREPALDPMDSERW